MIWLFSGGDTTGISGVTPFSYASGVSDAITDGNGVASGGETIGVSDGVLMYV